MKAKKRKKGERNRLLVQHRNRRHHQRTSSAAPATCRSWAKHHENKSGWNKNFLATICFERYKSLEDIRGTYTFAVAPGPGVHVL